MEITDRPSPPTGLRRLLWRLPIQLYRLGLGRLLGPRFLLLHHVGRVSGRDRRAVLEVVHHDGGGWTVASGFGPGADWYRNVGARPEVSIEVAGRRHRVTARRLSEGKGAELMVGYAHRHRRAATRLVGLLGYVVDGSDDDWAEVGGRLPFVRFEP